MRRFLVGSVVFSALAAGLAVQTPQARAASIDPSSVTASVQGLNVAVSWTDGDTAGVVGYTVSTVPQSPAVSVPPGAASAVLTGLRPGIGYTVLVAAQTASGDGDAVAAPGTVSTQAPGGSYVALTPQRLLDTRIALGAPKGVTQLVALAVTGHAGVPAVGVSAVALNVTVTQPRSGGYVTAYPAGVARPLASNLNFAAGATEANLVVVQVGAAGVVDLYASAATQLVADVSGYYTTAAAASPTSGLYHALPPSRILDTRNGTGGTSAPAGPGGTVNLQATGVGGVPASGVSAVVLNTTVTAPTAGGYVTVYPAGAARPTTSTLNFTARQTIANRTVVRVGVGGAISLFNYAGDTHLVVDVTGWFTDGSDASTGGSYYVALPPHRLVDTRYGTGAPQSPIAPGGILPVQVAGLDGLPTADAPTPATGAALTVTLARNTSPMYATVYPSLAQRPLASDLNAPQNTIVPNLTLGALGVDGAEDIYNSGGSSDFVVDLSGYYIGDVHIPQSTITPPPTAITAVGQGPDGPNSVTIAPGAPAPTIGQVIASAPTTAAPDGVLAQVTAVATDTSGASVAAVQPATLQQALGDADMAISVPLGANDLASSPSGSPAIGMGQLRSRAVSPDSEPPITGSDTEHCTGDTGTSVTITRSFNPDLIFEAHLGHKGFEPTITAKAGIDISEQFGASVLYGAKAQCSWNTQLAKHAFKPVTFDVAGVPVVIVPVFTLTLKADLSGQTGVTASISQNFEAQAGLQYADGKVSAYHSITNKITHTGPTFDAANATASLAVTGELEGKLYGIAGPDISLTATLTANADVNATPWWTLGLTLDAEAGLKFKKLFVHVDVSIDAELLNLTLAQATTPPAAAPPVITTTTLPEAVASQKYGTQLTTADHRTATWKLVSGTLPTGLTLSGFTISGTPAATGQSAFTIQFTDTTGHTLEVPLSITVAPGSSGGGGGGPTTGSITGQVTETGGAPLAGVLVSLRTCASCTQLPMTTRTDANGMYAMTDVPAATGYYMCFDGSNATGGDSDATGYQFTCYGGSPIIPPAQPFDVTGGTTTTGIGATENPGGAVTGQLTDKNGNPIGVDDVQVDADQTGNPPEGYFSYLSSFNKPTGSYTVKGVPPGEYTICFTGDAFVHPPVFTGYGDVCNGGAQFSNGGSPVAVTARAITSGIDVQMPDGAAITGTVTDTAGNPLSDVPVVISGLGGTDPSGYSPWAWQPSTNDSGQYVIGNLTAGTTYRVCFGQYLITPKPPFTQYDDSCYPSLVNMTTDQTLTGIDGQVTPLTTTSVTPSATLAGRPDARRTLPATTTSLTVVPGQPSPPIQYFSRKPLNRATLREP